MIVDGWIVIRQLWNGATPSGVRLKYASQCSVFIFVVKSKMSDKRYGQKHAFLSTFLQVMSN